MRFVARDETILDICRDRRVLHLGCVGFTDHPLEEKIAFASKSLHRRLSDTSDCIGIDNDAHSIRELQGQGIFQNVRLGNAEDLHGLDGLGTFDIVLASDLIEHLSNPGRMLECAQSFMRPDGLLVISTPNAFGLPNFVRYAAGRYREGAQHVLNFNMITLRQLLERYGYRVQRMMTCYQSISARQAGWKLLPGRLLLGLLPKFGGTLLAVASRQLAR
jgi:2-polyprenyl-3-methyl-5-hydroxy-6-metoxy-1,4-benzoquinol methylase